MRRARRGVLGGLWPAAVRHQARRYGLQGLSAAAGRLREDDGRDSRRRSACRARRRTEPARRSGGVYFPSAMAADAHRPCGTCGEFCTGLCGHGVLLRLDQRGSGARREDDHGGVGGAGICRCPGGDSVSGRDYAVRFSRQSGVGPDLRAHVSGWQPDCTCNGGPGWAGDCAPDASACRSDGRRSGRHAAAISAGTDRDSVDFFGYSGRPRGPERWRRDCLGGRP